jgi:hypothetical protein
MVGSYFKRRRALANGIAMCGSGIGTFIMSPLLRYLLDEYGWNGTILILAGVALNCCVFSAFFRPVTYKNVKKITRSDSVEKDSVAIETSVSSVNCDKIEQLVENDRKLRVVSDVPIDKSVDDLPKTDSGYASNGYMGKAVPTIIEVPLRRSKVRRTSSLTDLSKFEKVQNKRLMTLRSEHQFSHPQLSHGTNACSNKSLSIHSRILRNIITTQSLVDTYWGKENVSTMSRREIFMSGSAWTIPRVHTVDSRSDKHSIYSRYSHMGLSSMTNVSMCSTLRNSFFSCVDAFGFPLLHDPVLLLIVISCVFWTGKRPLIIFIIFASVWY